MTLQFVNQTATIACADPILHARLSTLLRHCQAGGRREASAQDADRFEIRPDGASTWLLARNESIVGRGLSANDAVQRMVYEVTVALATGCRELLVIHGAGASRDGRGILLCGASGCGKSTLVARLLMADFDFLSDEVIAVAPDGGTMTGFPRAIALKDAAGIGALQLASASAPARSLGECLSLDPEWIRPGSVRHQATPRALLFPRYQEGLPVASRRLSRAEAVYQLMHRLVNGAQLPDRGLAAASQLARALPAYSLTYPDGLDALPTLERLAEGRERAPVLE
ncbi:MAG: hypothetical protein ACRDIY_11670 [Chloroflexota bacterium]